VVGRPEVGWYRVEFLDKAGNMVGWTTVGVLARLAEAVPEDSPICVDAALSWYPERVADERQHLAELAALAGVSWIRDRLRWRDIQPAADTFAADTTLYDHLAAWQAGLGMKILQVFHGTPSWAAETPEKTGRIPSDLRLAYRFCKAMSERFKDQVEAWEPWNEANVSNFGGHTIDEICSHQKAAWLGFKAGNPKVTVGWEPLAGINIPSLVQGILNNETWPYYDTYNIHSYDWPDVYETLWGPAREAACGRPIWVTECDRGMKADPASPVGDLSRDFELRKAEFMAQSYASSLHAGSKRHFHFILGHYMEQNDTIQFGLLRRDLTPRPAYVALAALGRLLAGAQRLGRWVAPDKPEAFIYLFRARPDGREHDVMVAWSERTVDWEERGRASTPWNLPAKFTVEEVFDYLGRSLGRDIPSDLKSSPIFVVMPRGEADKVNLEKPSLSVYREGAPSPIVLQFLAPASKAKVGREGWTEFHDRVVETSRENEARIVVYNFSDQPRNGTVAVESIPEGWQLDPDHWEVSLPPMGREELAAKLVLPTLGGVSTDGEWLKVRGDFGEAGKPVLAVRFRKQR
jgi:hypothetical protein